MIKNDNSVDMFIKYFSQSANCTSIIQCKDLILIMAHMTANKRKILSHSKFKSFKKYLQLLKVLKNVSH